MTAYDDQNLAERCIALGIGVKMEMGNRGTMYKTRLMDTAGPRGPESFVRDWRVAGQVIERIVAFGQGVKIHPETDVRRVILDGIEAIEKIQAKQ